MVACVFFVVAANVYVQLTFALVPWFRARETDSRANGRLHTVCALND